MSASKMASSLKIEEIRGGQRLVHAAGAGDIAEVKNLLSVGVSVNAEEYNKFLLNTYKNFSLPLQAACKQNQYEIVKLLIEVGADVNARDNFNVTAVHIAADKGHEFCLRELLDAGAECSIPTKHSKEGCTGIPYVGGTTPLHLAAASNHVSCVIELIQAGADYNAVDEKGRTSLYTAAKNGFEECVLAHLKNAIGRDILSLPSLESGDTPLHFAVKNGMVEAVQELLNHGSDPNHMNHFGSSPLHYAVSTNPKIEGCCEKILHLLVLNGYNIDVNEPDGCGFTPLHYVCFNAGVKFVRRPNLARFLISYGANPLIKNHRGYNVIEYEMKEHDKDQSILKVTIQSMLHLPPLQSLKINVPPLPAESFEPFWQQFEQLLADRERLAAERNSQHTFTTNPRAQQIQVGEQKHQWYEFIASQPRTLQHYCRHKIRSSLGSRRLRHIKNLSVPPRCQHYLLLETDEP